MSTGPFILAIVQARMNSGRLPGKVMLPLLGRTIVGTHVHRLAHSRHITKIMVATTGSAADDDLAADLEQQGIAVFRGSENDVLDRFARCAAQYDADIVIRTTADCPLVDPAYVDRLIEFFSMAEGHPKHGSISLQRIPRGFDAEIITAPALQEAARLASDPYEREHVTPYLYRNAPAGSSIQYFPDLEGGDLRLCIDEPRDYEAICALEARFGDKLADAGLDDIVAFLRSHPDIAAINADVKQRPS
ncbi:MAG: glycosyltransferase family protein [Alphaproteobacteria bacterium]